MGTMDQKNILLMVFMISVAFATELEIEAFFNKTTKLPCNFKNPQNIGPEELVIFWQGGRDCVLYEFYRGKENLMYVNSKYINRTKLNPNTWVLQLQNVQIMDQGTYTCFVQHYGSKGPVVIHQFSFQLSVFAPFSKPEIIQLDNKTAEIGSVMNISCSANQGYPKPRKMYWKVETTNSTKYPGDMHVFQDNTNQLYNVTTILSLPINGTSPWINITCLVQTQESMEPLTSETMHIKIQPNENPGSNLLILGLVTPACAIIVILLIVTILTNCCGMRSSQSVNAEDNGHPKERDEVLEPMNYGVCEKTEDR
ncbi:T-lymphocyte activation antigen CD86 [Sarcophilus harrisii]|uniref:CD86 molecule n=1 Tax=Sarcophilus harrisii TaxID=9305 RepID=G3WFB3_SARHA|nr:T-lymphocyte activation antigen CD86 [Sarcophilus harrisii]XP_031815590.1 T-lymphocyte activation antigen CD86 [Sarcophilus harrisii]